MDVSSSESITLSEKCFVCHLQTDEVVSLDCGHLICAKCLYKSFDASVTVSKLTEQSVKCQKCQRITPITQKNKTVIEAFMLVATPSISQRDETMMESLNAFSSGKESALYRTSAVQDSQVQNYRKKEPVSSSSNNESPLSALRNDPGSSQFEIAKVELSQKISELNEALSKASQFEMNEGVLIAFNTCSLVVSSVTKMLKKSQNKGTKLMRKTFESQVGSRNEEYNGRMTSSSSEEIFVKANQMRESLVEDEDADFIRVEPEPEAETHRHFSKQVPESQNYNGSASIVERPIEPISESKTGFMANAYSPEIKGTPTLYDPRWSCSHDEMGLRSQRNCNLVSSMPIALSTSRPADFSRPLSSFLSQRHAIYHSSTHENNESLMRSYRAKKILKEQKNKESESELKRFLLLRSSPQKRAQNPTGKRNNVSNSLFSKK